MRPAAADTSSAERTPSVRWRRQQWHPRSGIGHRRQRCNCRAGRFGDNLSISVGSGAIAAISGPISENGGSHSLTLSGSGTLILSGSNDYSGGNTVTGGTLNVNSAQALPTTGMLVVGRNGRVVLGNITGAAEKWSRRHR